MLSLVDYNQQKLVGDQQAASLQPAVKVETAWQKRRSVIRAHVDTAFANLQVSQSPSVTLAKLRRQVSANKEENGVTAVPTALARSVSHPLAPTSLLASCSVCFEEGVVRARNPCPARCHAMDMCLKCSRMHWGNEVAARRFFVAPMTCFACRAYIPVSTWRKLAGETLFGTFTCNIESVNSVRCTGCEQDAPLSTFCDYETSDESAAENLKQLYALAVSDGAKRAVTRLETALQNLNAGSMSAASEVVSAVYDLVDGNIMRFRNLLTASPLNDFDTCDPENEARVLKCIVDMERRTQVHMAFMRRGDAHVTTPCCSMHVCFSCRFMDWHEGETCLENRERTKDEMMSVLGPDGNPVEVLTCPACFVQFEHAGGCSSVRCLCGHEFSLDSEMDHLFE